MSIGAPAASGRWDVRASMSQSDVSAWVLAGSFTSRIAASHAYGFGVSYSTQQYQNTSVRPVALAAVADETRNVGEIYGGDRWTLSPTFALEYGARYAHYDYLRHRSLFSPRVGFTLTPFIGTHVIANVAQRMLAPGAEEFLPAATVGPWLPPERTFTPLEGESFRVERARFYDLGIEHEFDGAYVLGVRRFQQRVDNQMATLFGLPVSGGPKSPGHYAVATAGALDAEGWAVRLSSAPSQRVRGSVDYSVTRAQWVSRGDMAAIAVWAPTAIRPRSEDVHDLTTSLETDVRQTATRVFVLYKINNAFARGDDPTRPVLDYRFDVQVNQALPFMPFSGAARWEVLVGLRNLFRDPNDAGSIYDELLVVRPPKRLIGGVLIRF
jgi:outer membrane receptor protein involved in Fe transport